MLMNDAVFMGAKNRQIGSSFLGDLSDAVAGRASCDEAHECRIFEKLDGCQIDQLIRRPLALTTGRFLAHRVRSRDGRRH